MSGHGQSPGFGLGSRQLLPSFIDIDVSIYKIKEKYFLDTDETCDPMSIYKITGEHISSILTGLVVLYRQVGSYKDSKIKAGKRGTNTINAPPPPPPSTRATVKHGSLPSLARRHGLCLRRLMKAGQQQLPSRKGKLMS